MSVPTTRVALAGFGAWGGMHARAIAAIEGAEVVAVLARSAAAREAAAQAVPQAQLYDDYAALLANPDIDVVNVVLPNHAHADAAVAALDAGKHVLLEKPLGLTLEQCDAVATASQRTGRLVAVNHELRVSRQWGAVRDLVAQGALGSLRHQHLSVFRKPFRTGSGGWRYDRARVGSWVLEELVHFIDLVLWYAEANGSPSRVTAFGGDPDRDLSDHFSVVLEWDDGATAVLNQCLGGFEHHSLLEIAGSGGALRTWWSGTMDRTETPSFEMKLRRGDAAVETIAIPLSGEVFELEENLRRAYAGFAAGHSIMSAQQARASVAVSLAAEQSWRTRQPVQLKLAAVRGR
ncbi:MAG: Gfo/Idh/MocA family oxidoreductase [Burkholderiaceae bacterium]